MERQRGEIETYRRIAFKNGRLSGRNVIISVIFYYLILFLSFRVPTHEYS